MAVGSSLTDQIGMATESTYGTYATPDHFLYPVEVPDFNTGMEFYETMPYGQVYMPSDAVRSLEIGGTGAIVEDARIKGLGLRLYHLLGAVNTSGAGPYTHVFTPAANPGLSATIQMGRTEIGATVRPFNYLGCVNTGGELAITTDQNPRLTTNWFIGDHETTTALATASYPSGATAYAWLDGAITHDGGSACVRAITHRIEKTTATDRRCIGGTLRQPILSGEFMLTGTMTIEFESMTAYGKWRAGTTVALSTVLTNGTSSLTIAVPVVQYRAITFPTQIGEVVVQAFEWKALKGGSALTTWTYVTADATP
jgi:hypothetical protein